MTSRTKLSLCAAVAALTMVLTPAMALAVDAQEVADAIRTTAEDNLAAEAEYLRNLAVAVADPNVTCRMQDVVAEGVPAVDYKLGVNRGQAYAAAVAVCASLDEGQAYRVRMEIVYQTFDPWTRQWSDIDPTRQAYQDSAKFGQAVLVGVNQYIFPDVNDPALKRMMRAKYTLTDPAARWQVRYSQPFLLFSSTVIATTPVE